MGTVHPGERNPNWRGGRTVDPRGYVLVKMPDHPSADVRVYVYEHRLVAEKKLGRRLLPSEIVHHANEDKSDNRPENLIVLQGQSEHGVAHRKPGCNRRLPGEANEAIACACGCGATLRRFDRSGRPRRFVSGHNMQRRGEP